MKTNSGNDIEAAQLGGDVVGITGTATATSATSLTGTGTPFVASAYIGHIVVATGIASGAAGGAYGVITANTTSVLTVDRWYNAATPGGAAATTPGATTTFAILPGGASAPFMAITANATAPSASDTTLTAEIATAGGGLIRKIATYAHSAGTNTYTLTGTFTVNGSDTIPVTVAKMATFTGMVSGQMLHETLLSATATLSAISDAVTITQTVTM